MFTTIDKYSLIMDRLPPSPIRWIEKLQLFTFIEDKKILAVWYFNMFFIIFGLVMGSSGILIANTAFTEDVSEILVNSAEKPSALRLTICVISFALACICLVIAAAMVAYGKDFVRAWNNGRVLEAHFRKCTIISNKFLFFKFITEPCFYKQASNLQPPVKR